MNKFIKQFLYKSILYPIPDKLRYIFSHYRMHKRFGSHQYLMNLKDPKTFNEKITWLKLYHRFQAGPVIADKYLVRDYVGKRIGEEHLIPLISTFNSVGKIDYSKLPSQFVLKPNHGSGWVIICPDKNNMNKEVYNRKLKNWMNLNFYYLSGEWQYKSISKKILCEELIQELKNIVDYKFYCFNGAPKFVQVDFDRHTRHTRSFYDLSWKKMNLSLLYPESEKDVQEPRALNGMIEIAKILSKDFTFCRVDLYDVRGKVYFGEITLHPEAGNGPFGSYEQDLSVGKLLDISHLKS